MKTVIALLFALLSSALAFVPQQATKAAFTTTAALPTAPLTVPAMAVESIVESLPTSTVALEVQFGAYLAVILGTLLPCLFLINLYIQTETRAAGRAGGQDSE
eukprot:CAMPEP_0116550322 /NCGR_PEP_ID=MMETSP0397-20121206/5365_1 /TAXON_ID=216820 /ORGANISM="Cyclophora tenuis, Strain ECT3854" /LENGTH=102 /DNA_ID=CAMNT_0004075145 /DNA_START=31 /DNA_END=339 /DNA_ORIENTATION=-